MSRRAPAEGLASQITFRLSPELHATLTKAANASGWAVGEEIRRRLEGSAVDKIRAGDNPTHRLIEAIIQVAINVKPPFGPWYENRFAFDTFRAAVLALIDLHRPSGVPTRPSDNAIADMYLGEDGTPEAAGRMIAGGAAVAVGVPFPDQRSGENR